MCFRSFWRSLGQARDVPREIWAYSIAIPWMLLLIVFFVVDVSARLQPQDSYEWFSQTALVYETLLLVTVIIALGWIATASFLAYREWTHRVSPYDSPAPSQATRAEDFPEPA
jgi:membrane-associated phospholipid phosphatase